MKVRYTVIFVFCMMCAQLFFISGCDRSEEKAQSKPSLSYAEKAEKIVQQIDKALKSEKSVESMAILKGLKWSTTFTVDENRFDQIYSDYLQMLAELTQNQVDPDIKLLANQLLDIAMDRAKSRLKIIFPSTPAGKWDFISVIPALCTFNSDNKSYVDYYKLHFESISDSPYSMTLEQAMAETNYDIMGDILIDYSYLDKAYQKCGKPEFHLPENDFSAKIQKVSEHPFRHTPGSGDDIYSDQNYYITHLVFVMTHYGDTAIENGEFLAFKRRILNYLMSHFHSVRYQVDDIDLLAEFVQCIKMYGKGNIPMIKEAVSYLLSKQLVDGSWRDPEEKYDDPYDEFHPTWAVMSALSYSYKSTGFRDKKNSS